MAKHKTEAPANDQMPDPQAEEQAREILEEFVKELEDAEATDLPRSE